MGHFQCLNAPLWAWEPPFLFQNWVPHMINIQWTKFERKSIVSFFQRNYLNIKLPLMQTVNFQVINVQCLETTCKQTNWHRVIYIDLHLHALKRSSTSSLIDAGRLTLVGLELDSGGREIPLTNRVRGPYRKLQTEFFPLRFMAQARSARAINRRGKNEDL